MSPLSCTPISDEAFPHLSLVPTMNRCNIVEGRTIAR